MQGPGEPKQTNPESLQSLPFPWKDDAENFIQGNCSVVHVKNYLLERLNQNGRIQVETFMVVIGALVGFSALYAVLETKIKTGVGKIVTTHHGMDKDDLLILRGKDGNNYFFGDVLNAHLLLQAGGSHYTLWNVVAGLAVGAGFPPEKLPNPNEIFSHVAKQVGTSDYGKLRHIPGHEPHLSPKEALFIYWPYVKVVISHTKPFGKTGPEYPPLAVKHWPAVFITLANVFVGMSKDTADLSVLLIILMESAVLMSKIDPAIVPQVTPQPFQVN